MKRHSAATSSPISIPATGERWLARLGRYLLLVFLAIALIRGLIYTFAVPPWQHPDEPTHFEHARMIAQTRRLPGLKDVSLPLRREIADSMLRHEFWRGIQQPALDDAALSQAGISPIGIYTFAQPRLYYLVAAAWLTPWLGLPVEGQLHVLRLLSVVLNLLVVACAFGAARLTFPDRPDLAIGAAAFVVFQPGYTDIMSAANNDALVNVLSAMLFLALAWLFNRPPSRRRGLVGGAAVVALLAAALLAKASALALLIAVPFAVFFYLVRGSKRPWLWVVVAGAFLVALAGVLALVLQTAMSPQGRGLADFISRYFRINFAGTVNSLLSGGRISYATLVEVVFKSFWAIFGWRHIYLAPWAYWLPLLGMTGAAIGLGVAAWRGARRPRLPAPPGLAFLALAAVVVAITATVAVLRGQVDQGAVYHSHGRYAYVAMVPFALLFAAGWLGWLPQARRRWGLVVFIAAVALFDAIAFWGFLVPYYYF